VDGTPVNLWAGTAEVRMGERWNAARASLYFLKRLKEEKGTKKIYYN
jgi:hypothetical protein